MSKQIISKELLSEVLGEKVNNVEMCDLKKGYVRIQTKLYLPIESINTHELAHKCKEWARLKNGRRFIVLSGFNTDIIEDDGNVALDCLEVDRYVSILKEIIHKEDGDEIKTIGFFGAEKACDAVYRTCQWILDN